MPAALADAGLHVLCAGSRYAKERQRADHGEGRLRLGQYVRHARDVLGYRKVVLVGWSGGGSLSLFYRRRPSSRASRRHRPAIPTI